MPLDTSSKRRSSVSGFGAWMAAPPSPTDSPGVVDAADREHGAWRYSGIAASSPLPPGVGRQRRYRLMTVGVGS